MTKGFDRLRPRTPEASQLAEYDAPHDAAGKRALFSAADAPPAAGSVSVECSRCTEHTVLSLGQALRASVPSVHLPMFRRDYPSWMRCPACGRRTWVRLSLHI